MAHMYITVLVSFLFLLLPACRLTTHLSSRDEMLFSRVKSWFAGEFRPWLIRSAIRATVS